MNDLEFCQINIEKLSDLLMGSYTFINERNFYAEEVYDQYYDSVGNYHWTGTVTGNHVVKLR